MTSSNESRPALARGSPRTRSKEAPDVQRLEDILRSSRFSQDGFLGDDIRPVAEIIAADAADLARLNRTARDIAQRMASVLRKAESGLGTPVAIDSCLEASVSDTRGYIPCPWPHAGRFAKTEVTARRSDLGKSLRWSALNIHLIEAHGFFEGLGSPYRLDPRELVELLFD